MEHVLAALQSGTNALLESPTGTGKTLSLLCASLAFIDQQRRSNNNPSRLIYTSRTHSQLDQVKRELAQTVYAPRCASLASRDHLCTNDTKQWNSGERLNRKCMQIKTHSCT